VPSKEFYVNRWRQSGLPAKYWDKRLEDYVPVHASGRVAQSIASDFVSNFREHYLSEERKESGALPDNRENLGKGLMLHGRNGTRKSTLAAAILTEIQYAAPAWRGYYIRFSEYMKRLTSTFDREPTEYGIESKKILRIMELVPILVIDDIGQEHRSGSGFTESTLHEFLRMRYEACRPTIVTTNISPKQMASIYTESFDSFRHDAFITRELLGRDARKIGIEENANRDS